MNELDIVIPVYNERENIMEVLESLRREVKTRFRVLILYDYDDDNTLPVLKEARGIEFEVVLMKNRGAGVHNAIMTGFNASNAPAVLVFPADEAYNAGIIDAMHSKFKEGNDVVVASRFIKGGSMEGGPLLKSLLVRVASFTLRRFAGVPASDASYGLRLFSKRILNTVQIESTDGFTYAIELLVKCHRLSWGIAEVPARWYRRIRGKSRFNLKKWLPHYFRWYLYAFQTAYLGKSRFTVKLKPGVTIL